MVTFVPFYSSHQTSSHCLASGSITVTLRDTVGDLIVISLVTDKRVFG